RRAVEGVGADDDARVARLPRRLLRRDRPVGVEDAELAADVHEEASVLERDPENRLDRLLLERELEREALRRVPRRHSRGRFRRRCGSAERHALCRRCRRTARDERQRRAKQESHLHDATIYAGQARAGTKIAVSLLLAMLLWGPRPASPWK